MITRILILILVFLALKAHPQWNYTTPTYGFVTEIATTGNTLIVRTQEGGFFISCNGGNSWSKANNGLQNFEVFFDLNLVASGSRFFTGSANTIFYTDATKINWKRLPFDSATYINKLYCTSNNLFASTDKGYYSFDQASGAWYKLNIPDNSDFKIIDEHLFASYDPALQSSDYGKTWTKLPVNCVSQVFKLNNEWFIVDFDGNCYKSTDKGKNWSQIETDLFKPGTVTPVNDLLVLAQNDSAFISNSITGEWKYFPFISQYFNHIKIGDALYFVTEKNGVVNTKDFGTTWQKMNNGIHNSIPQKICFKSDTLYCSSEEFTFYSVDQGKSWNNIDAPQMIFDESYNMKQTYLEHTFEVNNDVINISNLAIVKPFNDSLSFYSFAVHDSSIYFSTNEGIYFMPAIKFIETNIFNFFKGKWDNLEIKQNNIYVYSEGKTNDRLSIVEVYSCGQNYQDSDGNWKEKTPRLTYKISKVSLYKEIDKTKACNGFTFNDREITIGDLHVPVRSTHKLESDCIDAGLQKIYLINLRYLVFLKENSYQIIERIGPCWD